MKALGSSWGQITKLATSCSSVSALCVCTLEGDYVETSKLLN